MANNDEKVENFIKDLDLKNLTPEQISGPNGILKQLTKKIFESALNTEMTDHLGYEKSKSKKGNNNSRKATLPKQ